MSKLPFSIAMFLWAVPCLHYSLALAEAVDSKVAGVDGRWSYRSFVSNPDLSAEPVALGEGTMEIAVVDGNQIRGKLVWGSNALELSGTIDGGNPVALRFQGRGQIDGEQRVYDYVGYVVPIWPNGVNQRPAIVGSVVGATANAKSGASVGNVAQWIAVLQDQAGPLAYTVAGTIPAPNGKPSVLIFVKDSLCAHCREQVLEMAARLPVERVDVSVISATTPEDLKKFPPLPFRLVADPNQVLSRRYGVFEGAPRHATIVRDGRGSEMMRKVGDEPYMDVKAVLTAIEEARRRDLR